MKLKTRKRILSAVLSSAMLFTAAPAPSFAAPAEAAKAGADENLLKLWYDEPASQGKNILGAGQYGTTAEDNNWQQQTLPIGNSYMGANVYGEIANERLTFNHKALWNGGPSSKRPNYNGGNIFTKNGKKMQDIYQEVVDAFLEGNSAAGNMCNQIVGEGENGGYGVYQSWGDIYLTYGGLTGTTPTTDYERNLDFTTGTANVDFTANGINYHREYFISHPDNVLVMKLTADGGTMDVNVSFPVDNGENVASRGLGKEVTYTADAEKGTIVTAGELQDNQMKMNSVLKVESTDGSITAGEEQGSLDVEGASEIIIYVSADTDYKNEYPSYRTGETDAELAGSVADTVAKASEKGFDGVKESHMADYKELFDRVSLNLGQEASDKTTDDLLAAYKASGDGAASDSEKRLLETLLYQYGRYMTIASSRAGDLPSNLQGVWQNRVGDSGRVPWGSDFHMNVNLQMNYWPTYSANLAECGIPIIDYVNSLREPGRVTAEAYFGIKSEPGEANGFSAHTQNTPFGWTCPGWAFSWGWSPAAVPWIIQNCWEYYEYTGDLEYMRENLYPMMREEAILYDQILVDSGEEIILEDGTKSTRLVSAPAYSPEHGPRTLGNAYESELIWQLYEDAATAAELLGVDAELAANWKENQKRLAPIEIGDSGQIKEWFHETTFGSVPGTERAHRHMSHLLALFPGDQISVENQDYLDAAVISLNDRTDVATGWGIGQRINAWARTGNGNRAHTVIQSLFRNGIYPNLWDAHPPFQIDGNFGYTSGVNEMLMQSNVGYINILPAVPDAWASGSVDGILARGNFEIGIDWAEGKAQNVRILSNNGGECIVQASGIKADGVTVKDSDNNDVTVTKDSEKERITFDTVKGKTYTITDFGEAAAEEERLPAPTNVAAAANAEGVQITWNAVDGADSYNVYRKIGADFAKINEEAVTGTSFTDSGELDDAEPRYRVAAVKGAAEGVRSGVVIGDTSGLSRTVKLSFSSDKSYTGSLPEEMTTTSGSSISLPDCGATVKGYLFTGWTDGKNTYAVGENYTVPIKDTTLKAVWGNRMKPNWENWTATASSEENSGSDGPAGSAIDGDERTWWHSAYSAGKTQPVIAEDGSNNEITIDFGKTVEADVFEYLPRDVENANGTITGYQLLYSTTESGNDFTEISKGTWANDTNVKKVVFDSAISMRRIQLKATATAGAGGTNRFISAAEIGVYQECRDEIKPVTGVSVASEMTLQNGESKKLQASVTPADATYQDLTYKSSDSYLVKVSADGTVTAGKSKIGTAEITVTAETGESAVCAVTVTPSKEVEKINIERERIVLKPGDTATLTASVEPYYGTDKTIAWSVDDDTVASFENGKVRALKTGKAVVTAKASNDITVSCTVWVVEDPNAPADTASLDSKISEMLEKYSEEVLSGYTAESVEKYREALAKAQALLGRTDIVQPEVEEAVSELNSAAEALEKKTESVDRTLLAAEVSSAKETAKGDLSVYTDDSVQKFRDALKNAEDTLNNSAASQADIDQALAALKAAALIKKEPGKPDPGNNNNQGGNNTDNPGGQNPPGTEPAKVPGKNTEITSGVLLYKVTKSDAKNGTVSVKGFTAAGKKKTSVTIPATVSKDGYTFKVTAIDKKAFQNSKLKSVIIGSNVTSIGVNSFNKSRKLASIKFMGKKAPKSVGKNAFKGIKAKCKIITPKMKTGEIKKLKVKMKSAGKKVVYKKK